MARQRKVLPAAKQREEESLLMRSAESLGRMIGSLQRQLDDATKNLSSRVAAAKGVKIGADRDGQPKRSGARTPARTSARAQQGKSGSTPGATKIRSTAGRKSKRIAKSAAAKKRT